MNKMRNNRFKDSWRLIKAYIKLPQYIIEKLLGKLLDYVSELNFVYDELSANIDFDKSISPNNSLANMIEKIDISDIDNINKNILNTINFNILSGWKLYTRLDKEYNYENRKVIYLSKDDIKAGDIVFAERINDISINKNLKKKKRYLRKVGANEVADIEKYYYVILAKKTDRHDKMKAERSNRYERETIKKIEKLLKSAEKYDNIFGRASIFIGDKYELENFRTFGRHTYAGYFILMDRIDLLEKLLNLAITKDEIITLLNGGEDSDGYFTEDTKYVGSMSYINMAKSEEMKNYINSFIES